MNREDEKFLSAGDIFLDGEKHMVYVKDEPIDLTFKEYELLKLLIQNQGIVMARYVTVSYTHLDVYKRQDRNFRIKTADCRHWRDLWQLQDRLHEQICLMSRQ